MASTFGKYRFLAELGHGGMADVYLALAQGPVGFNKLVVVKRLRASFMDDPEFVAMLIDEARLAARLNHPNIVHTNEVGEIDGQFFIAMEYLEGQPLNRVQRRAQRQRVEKFDLDLQTRILADVLAGLHHAHELNDYDGASLGVVHRDVTPSNIFITYEGQVKLVDFGIAKASGRSVETRTGIVKGKVTYMPPEQALGGDIDRRADLFSVGIMLWEAAAGRRMWEGKQDVLVLNHLINGEIPFSPREVNPDTPDAIDKICRKALAIKPEDRFTDAEEFRNALEDYLANKKAVGSREIGKLTTEMFAEKRDQMKRVIERQLAEVKNHPASTIKPVELADYPTSGPTPSVTMPAGAVTTIDTDPTRQSHRPGKLSSKPEVIDVSPTVKQRTRGARGWLGVIAAAALVAGGVAWVAASRNVQPPKTAEQGLEAVTRSAAQQAQAAASEQDVKPSMSKVTLRAVPASAQFRIDDGEWLENPFIGEFEANDKPRTITVDAEDYKPKTLHVTFEKDVVLDVALEKSGKKKGPLFIKVPPPSSDADSPPPPPPPPPPDPGRTVDTGDPWG